MSDRKQLTTTQQAILYKTDENPEWSNKEIAEAVDCSQSHVSETLDRWDPSDMDEDGTVATGPDGSVVKGLLVLSWWLIKISVWIIFWPISIPYFGYKIYKSTDESEKSN